MIIKASNNLDKQAQFSFLSANSSAGATTFSVKNINPFPINWAIQVGKTGEAQTEIQVSQSAASGTLNLVGTSIYDHPVDTPVYAVKFDQLIFKRSTSGTIGTASAITDGTVSITPNTTTTSFDDTTGALTYAYKVCFRNSVTGELSSDSDWLTPSGYTFYSLYKLRERIKNKLFSASYLKSDGQINDWINEWMERMNNAIIEVNQDYSLGSASISHGADGMGTITSNDFKDIRRIWFTTNNVDWYQARKIHITEVSPGEVYSETNPYYAMIGDNVFKKYPDGALGTASIYYYKIQDPLVNDTDSLPICMQGYTKSFVDYALGQAYLLDDKDSKGQLLLNTANMELERFKQEMAPRSKTGPTYIRMVESINADDSFYFI